VLSASHDFGSAMSRLRQCVNENWREMRRQFRQADVDGNNVVTSMDFRQILRNNNVNMTEIEFEQLIVKYVGPKSDTVCYNRFIKDFLTAAL
jgi:Ca2+-binding EF-hand superfamily protein